MPTLCRLGMHKAATSDVWNAGHFFSHCTRCDQDMIRKEGGKWHAVPKGQHVVWRQATQRSYAVILPKVPGRESLPTLMNDMGLFNRESPRPFIESRQQLER